MYIPKRTKFRKYQKGKIQGIADNCTQLQFGKYGIKALQTGRIESKVIEAVRRVLSRKFKRTGKIWIRIFADIPCTKKPAEVRMGKGKGNISSWICRVKAGQVLFEMDGMSLQIAKQAALYAYYKFPLRTKFIEAQRSLCANTVLIYIH